MAETLVLLDGYSLMYRAFHALQTPMTAPDGTPTNAVHGFMMMLLKVLEEEQPDAMAVAFDVSKHTFRSDLYAGYKANRKPMPEDLRRQDPIIRELVRRMGIALMEQEGLEADDVLGTISQRCEEHGVRAILVTGDRDSFQLAGENTTILYTKRGIAETERVTPQWIHAHYGLSPRQLIDVKGLMGDASDNIPGVPGVGEKTAVKLIAQYGSLEETLRHVGEQKGKLRERLEEFGAQAELSKRLSEIVRDAALPWEYDRWKISDFSGALPLLRELGMNQAARKLQSLCGTATREEKAPAASSDEEGSEDIRRVESLEELEAAVRALSQAAHWAAICIGQDFSAAFDTGGIYAPLGGGDLLTPGLRAEEALRACGEILRSDLPLYLYNAKALGVALEEKDFDCMLAAYALNPQTPSFQLKALVQAAGMEWREESAALLMKKLCDWQREKLQADGLWKVYAQIELPLERVLLGMEKEGFAIDAEALRELGKGYRVRIAQLEEEIYAMAGEKVNLKSPKQLSELLYDRMGLPAGKKTNRGYRTTSAEVLESLAEKYPICGKILEYRKYTKLESTYVDALLRLMDKDGRVHTLFDQVSTATGRISSLEPNLQNIPVRTELGRQIRRAFVASEGKMLVDADYSQIELRVLAHMSADETMLEAFREGQDIHARTAAEVYSVPLDEVTPAMRSAAKAVNFGIVYGISDFTLAKNISSTRQEARDFIERYFQKYPGVKQYMERMVALGKQQGYVETLLGRRRYLPELKSGNYNVRAFGERCAMNSPIQGTAADIIKMAMIRVERALREQGLASRLILQVHDELIVEAPEEECDRVRRLLIECMEGVLALDVPLKIDLSMGRDWRACK